MKNRPITKSIIRTLITSIALSTTLFAVSAQANIDLTAKAGAAAETLVPSLKLSGMGGNTPGCLPERQVGETQCRAIADRIGEEMHSGAWAWAPKGCHFNTQHGSMWFNTHPTGSTANTRYTSVCKADPGNQSEGTEFNGENADWEIEPASYCDDNMAWDSLRNRCVVSATFLANVKRRSCEKQGALIPVSYFPHWVSDDDRCFDVSACSEIANRGWFMRAAGNLYEGATTITTGCNLNERRKARWALGASQSMTHLLNIGFSRCRVRH